MEIPLPSIYSRTVMSDPFFPTSLSIAPPTITYCRSRQGDDPDWERLRNIICHLYEHSKLKDVVRIMEADHNFKASEKLYKTKLKTWGVDNKRIKPNEYKAMLKKKRKREQDVPGKATTFELSGEIVPNNKIARWEDRMHKQGRISESDTFSDVGTPPNLIARTPTPPITDCSHEVEVMSSHNLSADSKSPSTMRLPDTHSPPIDAPITSEWITSNHDLRLSSNCHNEYDFRMAGARHYILRKEASMLMQYLDKQKTMFRPLVVAAMTRCLQSLLKVSQNMESALMTSKALAEPLDGTLIEDGVDVVNMLQEAENKLLELFQDVIVEFAT